MGAESAASAAKQLVETQSAATQAVTSTGTNLKNKVEDTQSAIKETAADVRRKVIGTALERFNEGKEYEKTAAEKLADSSKQMAEAKVFIDQSTASITAADKVLQSAISDEKAALIFLKKAAPAMTKVQDVTKATQTYLKNEITRYYAKADAELTNGKEDSEPRVLAEAYGQAARLEVQLKLLPNPEKVGGFSSILQAAMDDLDPTKFMAVRESVFRASADQKAAINSMNNAVKEGSDAVKTAIKQGSKPSPETLNSVKNSFADSKTSSKLAADDYVMSLKLSRYADEAVRSALGEVKSVRLDRWENEFSKENGLILDAQGIAKKIISKDVKAEEKAVKTAAKKLTQARVSWDGAEKSLEEAIRAENRAQELYTEAIRLGKEEAALFGKAL